MTTIGMRTIGAMGVKSFCESYGSLMPTLVWLIECELLMMPMV
mgnify:CR=1 FL=1